MYDANKNCCDDKGFLHPVGQCATQAVYRRRWVISMIHQNWVKACVRFFLFKDKIMKSFREVWFSNNHLKPACKNCFGYKINNWISERFLNLIVQWFFDKISKTKFISIQKKIFYLLIIKPQKNFWRRWTSILNARVTLNIKAFPQILSDESLIIYLVPNSQTHWISYPILILLSQPIKSLDSVKLSKQDHVGLFGSSFR